MTKKETVVIEAYTGVCMLTGNDRNLFYKYINQLMGRPVYTHELPALSNEIKEKAKSDFINICKNLDKKTRTRKFKFITVREWCDKTECQDCEHCFNMFYDKNRPYKTKDGKYILIEVEK